MKKLIKTIKNDLLSKGIKVNDTVFTFNGRLFARSIDAHDDKGNHISIEPQNKGCYFVCFNSVDPNKYGYSKNWLSCHYSNKIEGFQPVLTNPISEMKKEINNLFFI